jgi:hypothetical protein
MRKLTSAIFTNILMFLTLALSGATLTAQEMSVPAEFVRDLQVPGRANRILRPSAIFVDHQFNETFVADPGNNRIAIFDSNGVFRFEFSGGGEFSTPVDLAVDAEGFIWILGTTKAGRRLFVFDFDGLFVRNVPLPLAEDSSVINVANFDLGPDGEVYLLDRIKSRVYVTAADGKSLRDFGLLTGLDEAVRREQILGKIRVQADRLLVPCGSLGHVYVHDLNGDLLRVVGRKGTRVGELSFPVAAVMNDDGLLLVLDKHRFNVVCFDPEGKFQGEFGGRGSNPGWFYHPTLLDRDSQGLVYIGQIFQNKIQVCRIPDFINQTATKAADDEGLIGDLQTKNNHQYSSVLTLTTEGAINKPLTIHTAAGSVPVNAGINQRHWRF